MVTLVRDYDYNEDETYTLRNFKHAEVTSCNLKCFLESVEGEVTNKYSCIFKTVLSWQEVREV